MAENGRLNRNQRRAIVALLSSKTIKAAAEALGLNERTIRRYLEDADFRRALTQAEGDILDEAGRRLLAGLPKSLEILEGLMKTAESENVQRLAAKNWNEFILRWRELKIEQRITELEKIAYEQEP